MTHQALFCSYKYLHMVSTVPPPAEAALRDLGLNPRMDHPIRRSETRGEGLGKTGNLNLNRSKEKIQNFRFDDHIY